ncbi:hypothetical protein F53441_10813 [Fusarium austroafricanum]|uniref:Xylanolytic transcriptional activator regulatory domain-containing protein n=1 Tax=Fusarium austroafricanum TaxID=2364996 RepID=A0A8H4NV13_9HYPO|nr:hypothetical protein F53441_10813 [Fusarium austroafricanum]
MQASKHPRKACDLCYTRKIKCDGQQPLRKWKPKAQHDGESRKDDEIRGLQTQMKELQDQLDQYRQTENIIITSKPPPQAEFQDDHAQVGKVRNSMKLPPLEQTMHMIGIFLNTVNAVLPLFHTDNLLCLVGETYALQSRQRDPVAWAAINVVLAMTRQQIPEGNGMDSQYGTTKDYLNKAQSVLWAITLGETRLLNVQTLVGMAMLLQTGHDTTPALVIISAAMRLVHKMGLHNRLFSEHLGLVERKQHARVFWLAYIVDKDLSIRAQQPSVQVDDDIDLEFPMSTDLFEDRAGIITTVDGNSSIDYFLSRVQLAHIQGDIYDHLYSTRAWKRSPEERRLKREAILLALNNWKASITSDFGAANVIMTTNDNPSAGAFFCVLHTTSLLCLMLITRAHGWDEQWVGVLRDLGRRHGDIQLPNDWKVMVGQARDFMVLFEHVCVRHHWLKW